MALLSWGSTGGPVLASSAAIVALGCSFVLDTNDLHRGGAAGTAQTGSGGAAGASVADAAPDAPMCTFPDRDTCSDCLGMNCCTEYDACALNAGCNIAFVRLQMCQKAAKKAPNPTLAGATCNQAFLMGGGTGAAGLAGCTLTNCSTVCGG